MSYPSNNNNNRGRRRKKRYRLKPVPIFIALVILVSIIWGIISLISNVVKSDKDNSSKQSSSSVPTSDGTVSDGTVSDGTSSNDIPPIPANATKADWNLVLLNRTNSIDKDMTMNKKKFDTQQVDSRVAESYQKMVDAAKAANITLYLRSGIRTIGEQRANYDAEIQRQMSSGSTKEDATIATEKYYARAGQSEHHTGLALDIITPEYHKSPNVLDARFMETDAYNWLVNNCATYGFILRYPDDKVATTKINFEPWHYRYVGVENAKYMNDNDLCLEEYIALLP